MAFVVALVICFGSFVSVYAAPLPERVGGGAVIIWNDNSDEAGKRPSTIVITSSDGNSYSVSTAGSNRQSQPLMGDSSAIFPDIENYTKEETAVNNSDDGENVYTYYCTYTYQPNTEVSIPIQLTMPATAEEATEDVVEEKKEPDSDEIIEGLKAELDKAKNDVARAYADTENMKKRLQKDADATRKYRFQQPATEILPILDSMEMALKVQTEDETIKNYVKGFEMIHKQLKGVLEKEGVQEIDAADKPFDHNTMQALMQEKKEGVESGMVIEVLQKGYMLKDRILRPALVKVSE